MEGVPINWKVRVFKCWRKIRSFILDMMNLTVRQTDGEIKWEVEYMSLGFRTDV